MNVCKTLWTKVLFVHIFLRSPGHRFSEEYCFSLKGMHASCTCCLTQVMTALGSNNHYQMTKHFPPVFSYQENDCVTFVEAWRQRQREKDRERERDRQRDRYRGKQRERETNSDRDRQSRGWGLCSYLCVCVGGCMCGGINRQELLPLSKTLRKGFSLRAGVYRLF
jgi:hypothetical protein